MKRSIRIVNYAVNGSGVGHLTRLVGINRWIRRYAAHAGVHAEIWFLTSSEADGLLFAEQFASFKVPSKTIVAGAGIDKTAYLALAKQWVWHSLGLLRPDLFVVDTFPRGSFGELLSALDLCKRRALVFRPMLESFARRPDLQAMLPLYDSIIVPEREDRAKVIVPEEARGRVRYVGPLMVRERVEALPRDAVRAALGIEDDRVAVYVSAGGGGDPAAEGRIALAIEALGGDHDVHLVVGAGPLYRGRITHGPRITWLAGECAAERMAAFDIAVSAAGYNTFTELMHAGVPSVFWPQTKIADDQGARARSAERAGAAKVLTGSATASDVRAAVSAFRDPVARAEASRAARSLVPQNHARDAAAELLRLVLSPREVDRAEEAIQDNVLAASRDLAVPFEVVIDLIHALERSDREPVEAKDPALGRDLALRLVARAKESEVPLAAAARLTAALSQRLVGASVHARAHAAESLFSALAPFGDWDGAVLLVKSFTPEGGEGAAALPGEIARFAERLTARSVTLTEGLARLARERSLRVAASNVELLRAAGGEAEEEGENEKEEAEGLR